MLLTNIHRDLKSEFDIVPTTPLFQLEDTLALPGGCDEAGTTHLIEPFRSTQTFFLAEMSLKSILARSMATNDGDFYIVAAFETTVKESPLFQEFRNQMDCWVSTMPGFVGWAPGPAKGQLSRLGTRLKLLYWFTRLCLCRPLII